MNVREKEEGREGERGEERDRKSAVMKKTKKEERLRQNHIKCLSVFTVDFTKGQPDATFWTEFNEFTVS